MVLARAVPQAHKPYTHAHSYPSVSPWAACSWATRKSLFMFFIFPVLLVVSPDKASSAAVASSPDRLRPWHGTNAPTKLSQTLWSHRLDPGGAPYSYMSLGSSEVCHTLVFIPQFSFFFPVKLQVTFELRETAQTLTYTFCFAHKPYFVGADHSLSPISHPLQLLKMAMSHMFRGVMDWKTIVTRIWVSIYKRIKDSWMPKTFEFQLEIFSLVNWM